MYNVIKQKSNTLDEHYTLVDLLPKVETPTMKNELKTNLIK